MNSAITVTGPIIILNRFSFKKKHIQIRDSFVKTEQSAQAQPVSAVESEGF